ncbi:hypothetical protein SKAU_G00291810 [Synaphobranchus kaupii]|uniref:NADPH oxidase organizer 1 n=1 Tax=Synaphobranchus kaupii TaxID=118154 RepID=A0A9Q1ETY7_SYNKA|nr:hypothetical protein SKAU_G00291810 [Synaphobranchus kaupii]
MVAYITCVVCLLRILETLQGVAVQAGKLNAHCRIQSIMSDQRYPTSIALIGVMHKNKSKMFMTSVLWSDGSDIVVYRSFQDFKKLHKQLKKRFPTEKSFGKSDRLIPKFRGGTVQKTKKGPNKSMVRLKFLEKYYDQLLKCDPQITQSSEVTQFFLPTAQDLQPEFAKNSIVIMPSEDLTDGGDRRGSGVGNVTQPFVTETYRCVAPYETKDTKNRPFKVAVDEKVDVLIKDKAGWWLVENDNKCMAWFPAPYLEKYEDEENEEDEGSVTPEEGMLYCAVKNFKSTKADEASVSIGAVVEVLQTSDNGWWLIRSKEKVGYVPSMYLQPYNNPQARFATMQKELHSSTLNLARLQAPRNSLAIPLSEIQLSGHDNKLSRSQGNLLLSADRQPVDRRLRDHPPALRLMSKSLDRLSEPKARPHSARPVIKVEKPQEEEEGALGFRQSSLGSEWGSEGGSDGGSEFSLSDDSSGADTFSVSMPESSWRVARSLTPQPTITPDDRLAPSKSHPNLFNGPASPKVPPRPHAQEILSRCTTITRKAVQSPTKNQLTPDIGLITSR